MAEKLVFGIDLGTTNSCIAAWENEEVIIVPNKLGNNTTPSSVAFTQVGIAVGSVALAQQIGNPMNTIFEAKRIIGQNFDTIENDLKYLPFNVSKDERGRAKYNVKLEGESKLFSAEEISAIILCQLKENAQSRLEQEVI